MTFFDIMASLQLLDPKYHHPDFLFFNIPTEYEMCSSLKKIAFENLRPPPVVQALRIPRTYDVVNGQLLRELDFI